MKVIACPGCGQAPQARTWHHGYLVRCADCYDPTPDESGDAGGDVSGFGITRDAAIQDWNESAESH